ncbi:hypothetical protein BGX38DRAFT_1216175 [Terfezia claveryi]|nr:hypothetical protein BGX38DRAFT_1216175 [Terfezia claveryi]
MKKLMVMVVMMLLLPVGQVSGVESVASWKLPQRVKAEGFSGCRHYYMETAAVVVVLPRRDCVALRCGKSQQQKTPPRLPHIPDIPMHYCHGILLHQCVCARRCEVCVVRGACVCLTPMRAGWGPQARGQPMRD